MFLRTTLPALLALALAGQPGRAEIPPSPSVGTVETGAPSFVVLGPEALGLSTAPLDLQLLPDGRILAVAQHELAFGDGVRWEAFRATEGEPAIFSLVAVDRDGRIYAGTDGGIARIDLDENAHWRFSPVTQVPGDARHQPANKVATFADNWYWFGGAGEITAWRPGRTARVVGRGISVDRIYQLGSDVYLSDQSSGTLFHLKGDGNFERVSAAEFLVSESVTSAVPFGTDQLLVGTVSAGLKLFDGKSFRPFGSPGLLRGGHRITDLCAAGADYFAAAVDTVGIVFFDREGRLVQVLEHSLDHRLARVERLQYARNGVLWALLNDGVARVEFPAPVSHYEPLLASGLAFAQPLRHAGELWILADGRAMHGIYDVSRRLERLADDTPPGRYLFTMNEVAGELFGSNERGLYRYDPAGWHLMLPGIVNLRVGASRAMPGKMFYLARGEYGLLQREGDTYVAQRTALPTLPDSYNAAVDDDGVVWIEYGMSRVGRMDFHDAGPHLQIFGPEAGLARGWAELYLFEGRARFHLGNHLYRFEDTQQRFVEDRELLARFPQLAKAGGRPTTDSRGHLWYTANRAPQVVERPGGRMDRAVKIAAQGLSPTGYTADEDGVVWMFEKRRLARVDFRLPPPPDVPLQALITSVQFSASGRHYFTPGDSLGALTYADNSLGFHFAAPANPFSSPVTFEVWLEGAGTDWVATGAVGSANFNRLKEGAYVFHVRPIAAGTRRGEEDRLAFTIAPPWYRTKLAWLFYVLIALGLVGFSVWFSSFLQRRENKRLELLVSARTAELQATNRELGRQMAETSEKSAALIASEERYRTLNAELEQRVAARTAELSQSNRESQQRESLFHLVFEQAPVGISWKRADLDKVFHYNPTFRRILGLAPDAPTARSLLSHYVHPEDAAHQAELTRRIDSGESDSYTVEERFVLDDGRIVWGLLSVAVVRDPIGRVIQHIGILEDITQRKQAESDLADTYKNLVATSRIAGMAEVATGVLHNVGNVLTSLNISANLLGDSVRQSKTDLLVKLAALIHDHAADLGPFLTEDPKGRLVPDVLDKLAENAVTQRTWFANEIAAMQRSIDHIKEIVTMHQSYATTAGVVETLEAASLFDDALRMNDAALARSGIKVIRDYQPVPRLTVAKGKVLQILINLVRNARCACEEAPLHGPEGKLVTLRLEPGAPGRVRFVVRDNGVGILPENLTRIFGHGFTTRAGGHGFGLHAGALAASEMNGSLTVASDGYGLGATFTFELPVDPPRAENLFPDRASTPPFPSADLSKSLS